MPAPTATSSATATANGTTSGPTDCRRPGPIAPDAAQPSTAAPSPESSAIAVVATARGPAGSAPFGLRSMRARAAQPAATPAPTTSSARSRSHGEPDSGTIPRIGTPGTTPSCVAAGDTLVPAPMTNPGPATNDAAHTTRVGR